MHARPVSGTSRVLGTPWVGDVEIRLAFHSSGILRQVLFPSGHCSLTGAQDIQHQLSHFGRIQYLGLFLNRRYCRLRGTWLP